MTKKEIAHFQTKEASLYAELMEYKLLLCLEHGYKTYEDEKKLFDNRLYARMSTAWNTVYMLMDELDIPYLHDVDMYATDVERANLANDKLYTYQNS